MSTYPYSKTINGQPVIIEGPISVVTVDDKSYEIVDEAARTDITNMPDTLADAIAPSAADSAFKDALIDLLYPVGAVYISMNNTAPFDHGNWQLIGQGRALVGVATDSAYPDALKTAGGVFGTRNSVIVGHSHSVSGSAKHDHSMSHTHTLCGAGFGLVVTNAGSMDSECSVAQKDGDYKYPRISKAKSFGYADNITNSVSRTDTGDATISGSSFTAANNSNWSDGVNKNFQPSIAVYVWERKPEGV